MKIPESWHPHLRRMVVLKIAVASAMILAHFFPDNRAALLINLVWLFLF